MTRLQNFFSQHQTTDDSTSIDYDYSVDDGEATHYDLPLIPIINDNESSTRKESPPIGFIDEPFRDRNISQDSDAAADTAATILPNLINITHKETENHDTFSMEKTIVDENSNETRVNESDINSDQTDTTTVDESAADTTLAFDDQFEVENNYTMTTPPNEFVIKDLEKPQAETTISSDIHLGDLLLNDSLLIDDSFYEMTTDSEFDVSTLELTTVDESFDGVSSGEKASVENLFSQNNAEVQDLLKLPSKNPQELLNLESFDKQISSQEQATDEPSSFEKAPVGLSSNDQTLSKVLSYEKSSAELFKSPQKLLELDKTASTQIIDELLKKPTFIELSSDEKSFPKFVTVEKTSSKPSIVNGPFLIFGQPFTRPSTVQKTNTEKVIPESSSQAFGEASSSLKPTRVESFEYSTFDNLEGSFRPSTTENLKPLSFDFSTVESLNEKNITGTLTSIPPTTPQAFEFTPNNFPYENRIIKDDQQNSELESVEEANKFVYHHLPSLDASTTPAVVRFPSQQRVRFPDEPSRSPPTRFSWPRDNGGLMRFWQEQPLINDFKIFSRGHSRVGNFNRQSYRRNYRWSFYIINSFINC